MVKYLQLMLIRAVKVNACTSMKARTRVYAKASYKNTVHTTSPVEDMGQNPVFTGDGTNVCHFVYDNEAEFITIELFNRNHTCIGISKLFFTELARLMPEQDPEEKTLPVHVASGGYQKPFGELILTAQINQQKAEGKEGNLNVVLKQGNIKGLISIFGSRTTKMNAKLTYKHTTLSSGILEGMGNKFMWHADNKFTFLINSSDPDDVLEIEVYNGLSKVGQCKIQISLLITGEEGLRSDPREGVTRTADLLVKNKNVGFIEVAATFTKTIVRRNSYPQDHAPTPALYPPWHEPHQPGIPPHLFHHHSQPMPNIYFGYPVEGSPSSSVPQAPHQFYPPEQPHLVQPGHILPRAAPGPYEPSAPSAPPQPLYPPVAYPSPEAHGAPPAREEKKTLFQDHPEIAKFVDSFQ